MKKSRKLLCVLLALVMVVGLLPGMAFAADEDAETAAVADTDAESSSVIGDILDNIALPTYAVYVKTVTGIPAVGAVVTLRNQTTGTSTSYTADTAGKIFIPKSLLGIYTVNATWTGTLTGVKYMSVPGTTMSLGATNIDFDVITVFPVANIGLNYTNHMAYVNGYPDGTVQPNGNLTRAEAAQMIYKIMLPDSVNTSVKTQYSDVPSTHWASKAIAALTNAGIVEGTGNNKFSPDETITRGQLFTMIGRMYAGEFTTSGIIGNAFQDLGSRFYTQYINLLYTLGVVKGDGDGNVRADDPITRAEAMSLLNTILMRNADAHSMDSTGFSSFSDNQDSGKWYYYIVIEASNAHDYTVDMNLNILHGSLGYTETWTSLK